MFPRPPFQKLAISRSASVPTRKENVAACAVPTDLPSRELIGACRPTRQPAPTPSRTARPRLTAPRRPSLRLQPVAALADVDRHRRLAVLPHAHHPPFDQLAR